MGDKYKRKQHNLRFEPETAAYSLFSSNIPHTNYAKRKVQSAIVPNSCIDKNNESKYAILLNNKIIQKVDSITKFHKLIIDECTLNIPLLNVVYDLEISELEKNPMYKNGTYLVINNIKIYLVDKSYVSTVSILRYTVNTPYTKRNKVWTLIETK